MWNRSFIREFGLQVVLHDPQTELSQISITDLGKKQPGNRMGSIDHDAEMRFRGYFAHQGIIPPCALTPNRERKIMSIEQQLDSYVHEQMRQKHIPSG
jgi:hypothetical protein